MLYQAIEEAYRCALLVLSLYSSKSHRLQVLRMHAERIEPRLIDVWPRDTKFARRCFSRLNRTDVDACYSAQYVITAEKLAWLINQIKTLRMLVGDVCGERLKRA